MKRTQVDPKKLRLKRKAIVAITENKLEDVTGGCHGGGTKGHPDPTTTGITSRYCSGW